VDLPRPRNRLALADDPTYNHYRAEVSALSLRAAASARSSVNGTVKENATMKERLVLVGNGMAGMRTLEELLAIAPDKFDITVFGAEPHGNYNRIMLSPVLAGEKTVDQIMINDLSWYAEERYPLARRSCRRRHSPRPARSPCRRRYGRTL
jgi:hypothetical protein